MDKLDKKAEDTANEYKAEAASYMTFSLTNLEGTQHIVETSSDGAVTGSASFKFAEQQEAPSIRPVTDMQLCLDNWDLIRQWFNAVQDLNSAYLTQADIDLYWMIAQHLQRFNYPLPAPRFVGTEIFSKAEQLKRTKAQLGNAGAELEEMQPERSHELLGNAPALSIPQSFIDANNRPGGGWSGNVQPVPEQPTYPSWDKPCTVKTPAPAWYDYEQQKPVTAPPVGCEVIVLQHDDLPVFGDTDHFFNQVSKVVHTFVNLHGINLVTVELPDGCCCCFVLEMIAPVDYDKPTFNKFYNAAIYAIGGSAPHDRALRQSLEKLYKAGFKAPEQSK